MIHLKNKETGKALGSITKEQLQFLIDQLEEETESDQDYYLNRTTFALLIERGMDAELKKILGDALGSGDDVEIIWSED